jgi:hypothetical protein
MAASAGSRRGRLIKGALRVGRKGIKAGTNIADMTVDLGKRAPPHAPTSREAPRGHGQAPRRHHAHGSEYVTERRRARSAAQRVQQQGEEGVPQGPRQRSSQAALKKAVTPDEIKDLKDGVKPGAFQVHHKIPLDDGGTNSFDNLVLIKNDPYHMAITNEQIALTRGMKEGERKTIQWPVPEGFVYAPKPE